jgi:hypothetical protein
MSSGCIVAGLYTSLKQKNMNDLKDTLPQRFSDIERLAEHNLESALNEMIDLFEEAADSYYHDIVDSINIWVTTKGNNRTILE